MSGRLHGEEEQYVDQERSRSVSRQNLWPLLIGLRALKVRWRLCY